MRALRELRELRLKQRAKASSRNELEVQLERGSQALGVLIVGGRDQQFIPGDNGIFIKAIAKNSAAHLDGHLEAGDRLISVNGHKVGNVTLSYVEALLQATETIVLKVSKPVFSMNDKNYSTDDILAVVSTPRQLKQASRFNCMRVMTAGEKKAGKTSVVKTVVSEEATCTKEDDRTVVAKVGMWVPRKKSSKSFVMVDLAGHRSYRYTRQYFYRNAANNIVLICHDLSGHTYDRSLEWIDSILCTSPKSHLVLALTKIDLLDPTEADRRKEVFLEKLNQFLEKKLKMMKTVILAAQQDEPESSYEKSMVDLKRKYEWLKENAKDITYLVSCKLGYEETVEKIKAHILKLSEKEENLVFLEKEHHLLYERIGKIGLDVPQIHKHDESEAHSTVKEKPKVEEKATSMTTEMTPKDDDEGATEKTVDTVRTQYARLQDVIEEYKIILEGQDLSAEEIEERAMNALEILNQHGLIIYFRKNPRLQNLVFNDVTTFVNILKCVFHHEVEKYLEYGGNEDLVEKHYLGLNAEKRFDEDLKLLHQEGLMTKTLVAYLLEKNHCDLNPLDVIELLSNVEAGYSFKYKKEGSRQEEHVVFLPYFISQKDIPETMPEEFKNIDLSDQKNLSVTCEVTGDIKDSFLHYLLVNQYKEFLPKGGTQYRKVWSNGFCASVGECNAIVFLRMPKKDTITFTVKANVETPEGHRIIRHYVSTFNNSIDSIMTLWLHGMPRTKVLICPHCKIQSQMSETTCKPKVPDLYKWNMTSVINGGNAEEYYCKRSPTEERIPAALVQPLSQNDEKAKKQLERLIVYLKKHCSSAAESQMASENESATKDPNPHRPSEIGTDDVSFRHPVLEEHKDTLKENLNPNYELLEKLVEHELLSQEEGQLISQDIRKVKIDDIVKRVLHKVQDIDTGGLQRFIEALENCDPGGANAALGVVLKQGLLQNNS